VRNCLAGRAAPGIIFRLWSVRKIEHARREGGSHLSTPLPAPGRLAFLRLLDGILAELRDIFNVVPLLRWPVHLVVAALPSASCLGALGPSAVSVVLQGLIVLTLGLAAIFSGAVARRLRRWRWVRFPQGQEVAPFLPQTLTVLLFPGFLLAL